MARKPGPRCDIGKSGVRYQWSMKPIVPRHPQCEFGTADAIGLGDALEPLSGDRRDCRQEVHDSRREFRIVGKRLQPFVEGLGRQLAHPPR